MVGLSLIIELCIVGYCMAQQNYSGFMPGSSPATPNLSMDMCQRQANSTPQNVTFTGKHAAYINDWCLKYEEVLPCMGRVLPSANSASDWYLKLIYDQTMATRMSKSVCARFPYLSNLTCVENDMPAVGKCMHWTTKSAIDRFFGQFVPNEPLTMEKKKMASIYACIISVATAGCFHKEVTSCSKPQRKLMYDFYIMMSGNCREIAGIPDTTTPEPTTTSATVSTSQSNDKADDTTEIIGELRSNNTTPQPSTEVTDRRSSNNDVTPRVSRSYNNANTMTPGLVTTLAVLSVYCLLLL